MKKGFMYKMLYGNDKEQDYTLQQLPSTRTKQFFHIYKTAFGKLINVNMLTALFALPLIVWDLLASVYIGDFLKGMDLPTQFSYLLNMTLLQYGTEIPLIMLAAVGLAGAFYVIRKICWKAPVRLLKDFGKGIKDNYKHFLALGFIAGVVNMLANYFVDFSIYTLGESQFSSIFGLVSVVLLVILLLAVFMFAACQSTLYNLSFPNLITNSLSLTFRRLFTSCGVALLSWLPVILFQALPWVFLHIIGGCVTFVFSISFAVTMQTVYSHGVFDKHINQKQYPDFVGMGLSTGKSYFQAICDTTQTDLEPQGDGNEN